jgi:hypothetical protein
MMGEIIKFPKLMVELDEDEYIKFNDYKEKMKNAKSKAEMDYYYSQAKIIIENANKRKNQSNKN